VPTLDGEKETNNYQEARRFWIAPFVVYYFWKFYTTNFEFATAYVFLWFVSGAVLAFLWYWLTSKGRGQQKWALLDWLGAACLGACLLLLTSSFLQSYGKSQLNRMEITSSVETPQMPPSTHEIPITPASPLTESKKEMPQQLTSSRDIALIQTMLLRLDLQPGVVDGVMGSQTRSAIMRFERMSGLPETGIANTLLLTSLNREINKRGLVLQFSGSQKHPGCEIKGVMTDDDYRACGTNPPHQY
jgi:hypothetical protein